MSRLLDQLRARVEAREKVLVEIHGPDDPAIRAGRAILRDVEEIVGQLDGRRVTTAEAHAETGWSPETLQRWARAKLNGTEPLPPGWEDLDVEVTSSGYAFVLGTIPANPRRSAA